MSVGVRRRRRAAATLAIFVLLSIAAIAGAEVDSSRVDKLQARLSRGAVVRLTTTSGETERLRDVRIDEAGIVSARWAEASRARPALIVMPGGAGPSRPEPVPWERIASLEAGRRRTGTHALVGGLLGAGLGLGFRMLIAAEVERNEWAIIALPTAAGAGLGALIGHGAYRWETVYPDPMPRP